LLLLRLQQQDKVMDQFQVLLKDKIMDQLTASPAAHLQLAHSFISSQLTASSPASLQLHLQPAYSFISSQLTASSPALSPAVLVMRRTLALPYEYFEQFWSHTGLQRKHQFPR
jgi:hypothetical protein